MMVSPVKLRQSQTQSSWVGCRLGSTSAISGFKAIYHKLLLRATPTAGHCRSQQPWFSCSVDRHREPRVLCAATAAAAASASARISTGLISSATRRCSNFTDSKRRDIAPSRDRCAASEGHALGKQYGNASPHYLQHGAVVEKAAQGQFDDK